MAQEDSPLWRLTHMEPAVFRGLVIGIIGVLGAFGIVVAPGIPDALLTLWGVLMTVIQIIWTRQGVTPNDKVVVYAPDPVERPKVVLAGDATTQASDSMILGAARSTT